MLPVLAVIVCGTGELEGIEGSLAAKFQALFPHIDERQRWLLMGTRPGRWERRDPAGTRANRIRRLAMTRAAVGGARGQRCPASCGRCGQPVRHVCTELGLAGSQDQIAARPLVRAYASGFEVPLTAAEREALPWVITRQPLWGIGGWVAQLDGRDTSRAHARATFPATACALQLIADIPAWHAGLS